MTSMTIAYQEISDFNEYIILLWSNNLEIWNKEDTKSYL